MSEILWIQRLFEELGPMVLNLWAGKAGLDVASKTSVTDLVTEADTRVQAHIEAAVQAAFPGDVVLGEENGRSTLTAGVPRRCWIVDPIDGTFNFVRGIMGTFGVSVALACDGELTAGGILLPTANRMFLAERGAGAFSNGQRLKVSTVDDLSRSVVEMSFARPATRQRALEMGAGVMAHVAQIRSHGSAILAMASVAAGESEASIHPNVFAWDIAAGTLLVREAGGRVTNPDGTELDIFDPTGGVLVSNGLVHEQLVTTSNA